jgi:hypothetical protein
LKETLRKGDVPLRGKGDTARIDVLERAWLEEKRGLELEMDRLKERLKVAEERTTRDVAMIATLEERLKDSATSLTTNLEDLDGEDLNDELNTSRKNMYTPFLANVTNFRRLQIIRLEKELAASKAEAEFNKLSAGSG